MCPSPSELDTCPFLFVSTASPPPLSLIKSHSFYKSKLQSHLIHHNFKISVQFSCSVVSNSLWPHGLQHARPPYPLPTPRVSSNSCPLSQWSHPTISFSVVPFFSCLQSFLASGSFQISHFFTSGGQSIGVSASASVLPGNIQASGPITSWEIDGETV